MQHIQDRIISNSLKESLNHNLGDYLVLAPLSRGAGGYVFHIKARKSKKQYALKVIYKDPKKHDLQQRFNNQVKIHKMLRHKNIVSLHSSFQDQDNYYMVMQYCQNGDLHGKIKKQGKLQLNKQILKNIGQGLSYMHSLGIIHRDLKPQNILICSDGTPKICDFGFSVQLQYKQQKRNQKCGTLNWIAPEILQQKSYSKEVDLWALGCISFYVITGKVPFQCTSYKEAVNKIRQSKIKYPCLPKKIISLLTGFLRDNPKDRMTIQQYLQHSYFEDQTDIETTISSLKRTRSSKNMMTISDLNNTSNNGNSKRPQTLEKKFKQQSQKNRSMSPLNLKYIKPTILSTPHGQLIISSKSIRKQSKRYAFEVSQNGRDIILQTQHYKRIFEFQKLPSKYQKVYKYLKDVVNVIKKNTWVIKLDIGHKNYMKMADGRYIMKDKQNQVIMDHGVIQIQQITQNKALIQQPYKQNMFNSQKQSEFIRQALDKFQILQKLIQ